MFVSAIADVLVDESSCHAWFMRTPLHREAPSDYAADCRPCAKTHSQRVATKRANFRWWYPVIRSAYRISRHDRILTVPSPGDDAGGSGTGWSRFCLCRTQMRRAIAACGWICVPRPVYPGDLV